MSEGAGTGAETGMRVEGVQRFFLGGGVCQRAMKGEEGVNRTRAARRSAQSEQKTLTGQVFPSTTGYHGVQGGLMSLKTQDWW